MRSGGAMRGAQHEEGSVWRGQLGARGAVSAFAAAARAGYKG